MSLDYRFDVDLPLSPEEAAGVVGRALDRPVTDGTRVGIPAGTAVVRPVDPEEIELLEVVFRFVPTLSVLFAHRTPATEEGDAAVAHALISATVALLRAGDEPATGVLLYGGETVVLEARDGHVHVAEGWTEQAAPALHELDVEFDVRSYPDPAL